jgi:hypothetical protein
MEDDLHRREFGETLFELAVAAGLDKIKVPKKADAAHIRYFHATVDKLYRQDQQVGGATLVQSALRQYHRARRILEEADYDERIGVELMTTAGDLAVCAGWLCYDAGNQPFSRQLYSEALLLANEADDDALKIRAMEKMSMQAVFLTHNGYNTFAREAVRLARHAASLTRGDPSPSLHALLSARQAISYATIGDKRGFNAAITKAWREMDREFNDTIPVWLQFVTRQEISIHEARGQGYLGDQSAAVRLFQESLENPKLSPRNRANYRAQLATALIRTGDKTSALAQALAVLPDLEGQVASTRTLRELRPIRIAAEEANETNTAEFCIRYDKIARQVAS